VGWYRPRSAGASPIPASCPADLAGRRPVHLACRRPLPP
jgi:hypothetical protein